jgi:hypothetical protein
MRWFARRAKKSQRYAGFVHELDCYGVTVALKLIHYGLNDCVNGDERNIQGSMMRDGI